VSIETQSTCAAIFFVCSVSDFKYLHFVLSEQYMPQFTSALSKWLV